VNADPDGRGKMEDPTHPKMSTLQFVIQSSSGSLFGMPVVADVFDEKPHRVATATVPIGTVHSLEVPSGHYGVRITLPSGDALTESVPTTDQLPPEERNQPSRIGLEDLSPHEYLQTAAMLSDLVKDADLDLDSPAFVSSWARLWQRDPFGAWTIRSWEGAGEWNREGVNYQVTTTPPAMSFFQLGGPQVPWQLVAIPPGTASISVLASRDAAGPQLGVVAASANARAQSVLSYLTSGSIGAAREVAETAEELLYGKLDDAFGAAVGGYYLLRTHNLARLHEWAKNLADWMPWLPDGAVIRAWQLIREQQASTSVDASVLAEGRRYLLEASRRGVPLVTEGLRLLLEGLSLFDRETQRSDHEIATALQRTRAFITAADLTAPTTTFLGTSPDEPTAERLKGVPQSREGLVFVYRLTIGDLIDQGLLADGAELRLVLKPPPKALGVAARDGIRLKHRPTQDIDTATLSALGDVWNTWRTADGAPISNLVANARTGQPLAVDTSPPA
jgi:hypothetical protein